MDFFYSLVLQFVLEQVFTFKDREEVENVVPTATTILEYYDPTDPTIFQHYKDSIDALFAKVSGEHSTFMNVTNVLRY